MIWDSIPVHTAFPVREFVANAAGVKLELIPQYAPELNPADGVWAYIKFGRLANYTPKGLPELRLRVVDELFKVKRRPDLLHAFIRKAKLNLDA
jgi:putative transposase